MKRRNTFLVCTGCKSVLLVEPEAWIKANGDQCKDCNITLEHRTLQPIHYKSHIVIKLEKINDA